MKVEFQLSLTIIFLACCLGVSGAVYPVKISSSNSRILVDQNNVPFMMVGDSPQALVVNLSQTDAETYITAVSYTHLDVYKRQRKMIVRLN